MINKKFMILAIFLVSILAISTVSAADNATEDIVGVDETTDEVISVNENQTISEDDVLGASPGTFTDLANEIANAGTTLNLNRDYTYTGKDSYYKDGITIDKTITVNGNGHTINGNSQARAFIVEASNVVLNNINFENSRTDAGAAGGAIYWFGSNGVLKNCNFMNSYSSVDGGAVYWIGSNGKLSDCTFERSSSKYSGGAVYVGSSEFVLTNCNFIKGSAGRSGGAVYWSGSNGLLSDCSFKDFFAYNQGGAVYLASHYTTLSGCSFVNSESGNGGGAIRWIGDDSTLTDCSFVNSTSTSSLDYPCSGGAVLWDGKNSVLSDCSFENSYCDDDGGAVSIRGSDCVIQESGFINSHAGNNGGGIYFSATNSKLICPTFEGNSAKEGSDWYSVYDLIIINDTKTSTLITAPDVTTTYGVSKNLVATLKDIDNNLLAGEAVSILLNNVIYPLKTNSKGQVSLAIPTNLAPKTYVATVNYAGNSKYKASSITTNVIVNKASTALSASDVTTVYNSGGKLIATLKDANGKAISGAQVKISLNGITNTLTTNSNGQVSLTTNGLVPDTYTATITFDGNNLYAPSSTTAKVTVNKMDTKLTAKYDANTKNIVATVKDANGNPLSGVKVGFAIGGVKYVTTDANGQAKYSTASLANGTYKVTVQASGNEIYKDSNKETVQFTIGSKEMSKIFLRNALYFVTQTKMVQVTLWDGNNQPLAGKTVYIRAYDSVWHGVTDENGDAFVRVGIGFGVHDATVSFDGDDQYNASTRAGYIRVIKQTPSVMVRGADTMFKVNDDNKIVKVHLRDRYDKALPEGSKIVIKLNGKTYVGTTDINGVAHIKININTVGTFTAQAMYGGNTAYNPVTRDVKIRIV